MDKRENNRDRRTGTDKVTALLIIIGAFLALAAGIFFILKIIMAYPSDQDEEESTVSIEELQKAEKDLADRLAKEGMGQNVNLIYADGGTMTRYEEISGFITGYFRKLVSKDYQGAYDLYATDFLDALGYAYPYEMYAADMTALLNGITEGFPDGEAEVFVSRYTPYSKYDIAYVTFQCKIKSGTGYAYENACTKEYTIIKDASGNDRLLDVPYTDFAYFASARYVKKDSVKEGKTDGSFRKENGAVAFPQEVTVAGGEP